MKLSTLAIIVFSLMTGCASIQTLPEQGHADEIRVVDRHMKEVLGAIHDQAKIDKVIAFINSKRDGWDVPLSGPPVGQVYINFYKTQKYIGNFYIGPYFFGRDHGNFWSKPASKEEIKQFGDLLGIELSSIIDEAR